MVRMFGRKKSRSGSSLYLKQSVRRQISDDICRLLFFLSKLSLENKFIRKVERLMSNSVDPNETAHMSRLIWTYVVCKSLLLSPAAVKVFKIHSKFRKYFFFCHRNWGLTFHMNCLLCRRFTRIVTPYFLLALYLRKTNFTDSVPFNPSL